MPIIFVSYSLILVPCFPASSCFPMADSPSSSGVGPRRKLWSELRRDAELLVYLENFAKDLQSKLDQLLSLTKRRSELLYEKNRLDPFAPGYKSNWKQVNSDLQEVYQRIGLLGKDENTLSRELGRIKDDITALDLREVQYIHSTPQKPVIIMTLGDLTLLRLAVDTKITLFFELGVSMSNVKGSTIKDEAERMGFPPMCNKDMYKIEEGKVSIAGASVGAGRRAEREVANRALENKGKTKMD